MTMPRILHTIWVGSDEPEYLRRHALRWLELHPGWEWRHWCDAAIGGFGLRYRELYDNREKFSPKSNDGQWKSNIARLEILHRFGGVYLDADMEPRKTVPGLEESSMLWAGWETQDVHVNNAFLACPPGHPAVTEILDGLEQSVLSQPKSRSNRQTGGHHITPIVRDRDDVVVLDQRLVYPYRWDELERGGEPFEDALMVHHWANWRRGLKVPL